jgi:hypothetical protein
MFRRLKQQKELFPSSTGMHRCRHFLIVEEAWMPGSSEVVIIVQEDDLEDFRISLKTRSRLKTSTNSCASFKTTPGASWKSDGGYICYPNHAGRLWACDILRPPGSWR